MVWRPGWDKTGLQNIPKGAHEALAPYIKQSLSFLWLKVNLEEQAKLD